MARFDDPFGGDMEPLGDSFNAEFTVDDITQVTPRYNFDKVGGGSFTIQLGSDDEHSFNIKMAAFVEDRMRDDGDLFMYMMNNYRDQTISHAIQDLYDIGFPIDEWVKDYIAKLTHKSDKFLAMMSLLDSLRRFGDPGDDISNNDDDWPDFD